MIFLQPANTNTTEKAADTLIQGYEKTHQSINNLVNSFFAQLPYILAGLLVLFIFWLLAKILKRVFLTASHRTRLDERLRILFSRLIVVFIVILGIFTALTVIIPEFRFGDLIAGLGFTSFIIGFATRDILNNLLSGVLILWQQPFRVGDYIFVGSNQGKVEYIGVRATQLRKDDGELVLIPNGEMYSSALTIRGASAKRRMLLKIIINYASDIDEAKKTIAGVLKAAKGALNDPKPSVVVTDLTADGVNLSIYFWTDTDKTPPMEVFDRVATDIKSSLNKAGIGMFSQAPPTGQTEAPEPSAAPPGKKSEDL